MWWSLQTKRLMIDLMCLRQSYERRKIAKIRWIDDNKNSINVMIKSKTCTVLQNLIDSNKIDLEAEGWVKRNEMNIKNEWWMSFRFFMFTFFLFQSSFSVWSLHHIHYVMRVLSLKLNLMKNDTKFIKRCEHLIQCIKSRSSSGFLELRINSTRLIAIARFE